MTVLEEPRFARRLRPARPDLAAGHLRGQVEAARFAEGVALRVTAPVLDLVLEPGGGLATQLLHGETFTVYDMAGPLAWGQAGTDGYVGHVAADGLGPLAPDGEAATVTALWSHVYAAPEVKARVTGALPLGARLVLAGQDGAFARLAGGGWVPRRHLEPVAGDAPAQAARLIGVPYLWGGRSAGGIDCSGLVQCALAATGRAAPRDSDMQEVALGAALDPDAPFARGDLVFWRGHVGMLLAPDTLIHANAHHMAVTIEPFGPAAARIAATGGGPVTSRRRLRA